MPTENITESYPALQVHTAVGAAHFAPSGVNQVLCVSERDRIYKKPYPDGLVLCNYKILVHKRRVAFDVHTTKHTRATRSNWLILVSLLSQALL